MAAGFKERIFVAAAGNPSAGGDIPDITEEREQYVKEDKWSENLLFIGVWGKGHTVSHGERKEFEMPYARGADIYVRQDDLEKLDLSVSSSFATPVVARLVDFMLEYGVEKTRVREKLQKLCQRAESGEQILDFEKVREYFKMKDSV